MSKDIFGIECQPENNSGYNQKLLDLLRSYDQGWYIANGMSGYLYNGVIRLLEDTFYSSINYWSPKHGWEDDAFENFLNDKLIDYNKDDYIKWFWGKRKKIYNYGDVKVAVRVYDSSNRLVLENIERWDKFHCDNVRSLEMYKIISHDDKIIKLKSNQGKPYDEYYVEIVNVAKEEIDFKNKIKVYIKEPNIPEYIQLWDKFDREECEYWIFNKYSKDYILPINNKWLNIRHENDKIICHNMGIVLVRFHIFKTN